MSTNDGVVLSREETTLTLGAWCAKTLGALRGAQVRLRQHREIVLWSSVRDIRATLTAGRPNYRTDVDPLGGLRQLERLVQQQWWLRRCGYQTHLCGQWRRWVIVIEGGHSSQARPPRGERPTDDGTL